jgi:hypothetical protein
METLKNDNITNLILSHDKVIIDEEIYELINYLLKPFFEIINSCITLDELFLKLNQIFTDDRPHILQDFYDIMKNNSLNVSKICVCNYILNLIFKDAVELAKGNTKLCNCVIITYNDVYTSLYLLFDKNILRYLRYNYKLAPRDIIISKYLSPYPIKYSSNIRQILKNKYPNSTFTENGMYYIQNFILYIYNYYDTDELRNKLINKTTKSFEETSIDIILPDILPNDVTTKMVLEYIINNKKINLFAYA